MHWYLWPALAAGYLIFGFLYADALMDAGPNQLKRKYEGAAFNRGSLFILAFLWPLVLAYRIIWRLGQI